MKTTIVSISAKNVHKQLSAWCLKAFADEQGFNVSIVEASINENMHDIIEKIFNERADIIAFSCYIWNIELIKKIAPLVKKLMSHVSIVLGGPEVVYDDEKNYCFADEIIRGGEIEFCKYLGKHKACKNAEDSTSSAMNAIGSTQCKNVFKSFPSPFTSDYFESFKKNQISDISKQLIYVETSRGCPFSCSYCMSSVTHGVEYLPIERVRSDIELLVQHGAKIIKFVDRTFNANSKRAAKILEFIFSLDTDATFHFEVAADLFDDELFSIIEKMPIERVQFEIGIQSLNEKTLKEISRVTDIKKVLKNIKKLCSFKNCHVHVDLIAGMPHETMESFSIGINECIKTNANMLQLGFLKMLKGTTIRENNFGAIYSDTAPYEVIQTNSMSYFDITTLKKIEKTIEKYHNSGMFKNSINYGFSLFSSPYAFFKAFSGAGGDKNATLKNAYTSLLKFLKSHGDEKKAKHFTKLDCLTHDPRAPMPDEVEQKRDKQLEIKLREKFEKNANYRVEYFDFDNKNRLFDYSKKDKITGEFCVTTLD
ncbi:MAG: B12-binding domain-containing radical SAM protein [Firmicutes bacterium]|nr:B12-binding domain-containing radical SAM protein [Bacillota bacterium]MCL2255529.1 B12-binding domain-containing radical SAM protein [Bacillota bacterium]